MSRRVPRPPQGTLEALQFVLAAKLASTLRQVAHQKNRNGPRFLPSSQALYSLAPGPNARRRHSPKRTIRLPLEAKSHAPLDLRHQPPPPRREILLEKHCLPAALHAVAVPARTHSRVVPKSSFPKLNPFAAAAALSRLSQPLGFPCQTRCRCRVPLGP